MILSLQKCTVAIIIIKIDFYILHSISIFAAGIQFIVIPRTNKEKGEQSQARNRNLSINEAKNKKYMKESAEEDKVPINKYI